MSTGYTIQRHIIEQQREYPEATGEFTDLLLELVIGLKSIAHAVRRGGVSRREDDRSTGNSVDSLTEFAQKQIYESLDHSGLLFAMSSMRIADPISIPKKYPTGKYLLVFDPLNYAHDSPAGTSAGTIFSIYRKQSDTERGSEEDYLQPGMNQVAAGYVVYGSTTVLVYTSGAGVYSFILDDVVGEFLLEKEEVELPDSPSVYSTDETVSHGWTDREREVLSELKRGSNGDEGMDLFYTGCLVSDFHQVLMRGGIYLLPVNSENRSHPHGRLRLLHQCAPISFICRQAGGMASTGKGPLLEVEPRDIHQRSPIFVGNTECVEKFLH